MTDLAAEVGQRVVGRGPGSVGEPVGELHDPAAQRLEGHRDDSGRDHGGPEPVGLAAEQPAHAHDQEDVAGRDDQRRHAVDDRAIDDHVDVVEPVPEDRDGEADRQQEERHLQRHSCRPGLLPARDGLAHDQRHQPGRQRRRRDHEPAQLLPGLALRASQPDDHAADGREQRDRDGEHTDRDEGAGRPRRRSPGPHARRRRRAAGWPGRRRTAAGRARQRPRRSATAARGSGRPARAGT